MCFLAVLNIKDDIPDLALALERLDWTLLMIVFNSRTLFLLCLHVLIYESFGIIPLEGKLFRLKLVSHADHGT